MNPDEAPVIEPDDGTPTRVDVVHVDGNSFLECTKCGPVEVAVNTNPREAAADHLIQYHNAHTIIG